MTRVTPEMYLDAAGETIYMLGFPCSSALSLASPWRSSW